MKPNPFAFASTRPARHLATILLGGMAYLPHSAHAAAIEWNNTGTDWATGSSWVGGVAPSTSPGADTAVFGSTGTSATTVNLAVARYVSALTFNTGAYAYTLTGATLTIQNGITNNAAATQTINMNLLPRFSQQVFTNNGGALIISGNIDYLDTGRTLGLAGSGNTSINGAISSSTGAVNVTVTSTGTTVLSGNNSYTGSTTMNAATGTLTISGNNTTAGAATLTAGTLNVNHAAALSSGLLTLTAGTLNNTSGAAITNTKNNLVAWGGTFTFGTAASTSANNLNLGTGAVSLTGGRTLTMAGGGTTLTMGAITSSSSGGASVTVNGAGNTLVSGGLTISTSATAAVNGTIAGTGNHSINGVIQNGTAFAHGLNITSTGITQLNGNNTYGGTTTISSGATARLGHASALGATIGGTTVNSGGVLDLNGQAVGSEALSLNGIGISSGGAITNTSATAASFGGIITLAGNTSIGLSSGSIALNGNIGETGGVRALSLVGTGTLILGGSSSYSGITTLGSATHLRADTTTALSAGSQLDTWFSAADTATLTLAAAGSHTMSNLNLRGVLRVAGPASGSATLTFTNGGAVNSSNDRNVTVGPNATVIFGSTVGGSFFTGSTTAARAIGLTGAGNIVFNSIIRNNLDAPALVSKSGDGIVTLNAANTYSGGTTVTRGTLLVNNLANSGTGSGAVSVSSSATLGGAGIIAGGVNVSTGGFISPGNSAGNLTLNNGLSLAGSYVWELAALDTVGPGTHFDTITVTGGSVDLTGATLGLNLGLFAPSNVAFWQQNQTWAGIINNTGAGALTGSFAAINNTSWSSLGSFSTNSPLGSNDVNLVWTAVPEPSAATLLGSLTMLALLRRRRCQVMR